MLPETTGTTMVLASYDVYIQPYDLRDQIYTGLWRVDLSTTTQNEMIHASMVRDAIYNIFPFYNTNMLSFTITKRTISGSILVCPTEDDDYEDKYNFKIFRYIIANPTPIPQINTSQSTTYSWA